MKSTKYSVLAVVLLISSASPAFAANLVINNSFETNTFTDTGTNLSNTEVTNAVEGVTAFGVSNEIDLVMGSDLDTVDAQDGNWRLRLHSDITDGTNRDAFSMALTNNLVIGQKYALSFYAVGSRKPRDVEIGLSNDANSFGTNIFSSTEYVSGRWTLLSTMFTATDTWEFLTVRSGPTTDAIANVDNFSLEAVGSTVVPVPAAVWFFASALLGLTGLVKRKDI